MYYAFDPSSKNLGGAEMQTYILAKELSRRNYNVSAILKENRKPPGSIRIFVINKRKILSTFSLFRAMCRADADIYYQRTGGFITGIIGLFCTLRNRKFVFHVSSMHQCRKDWPRGGNFLKRVSYRWGLKGVAKILVQTENQRSALKKNFGFESSVIRNMVAELPTKSRKENMVLWVGTVNERKRPDVFLRLASSFPKHRFVMIGGKGENQEFYRKIERQSQSIKNLEFLGFRPYEETQGYFQKCKVFVNTSMDEGFPNTYLQAWSNYVPVVALEFDPDEIICKNSLGFHSRNFDNIVRDVRLLMEDERMRRRMALNGRLYVEKNHKIEKIISDYADVFRKLVS